MSLYEDVFDDDERAEFDHAQLHGFYREAAPPMARVAARAHRRIYGGPHECPYCVREHLDHLERMYERSPRSFKAR